MTVVSMEKTFNLLSRLLNYVFAIPMLILGMIGSLLIILVFTRKRAFRRNTSLTYLLAGAIIIFLHLPTIYIQMILVYGFDVSLMNTNLSACREHTYLRYVTTVAAISFPCWAAFDQCVSTSRNVTTRNRWGSLRLVRAIIVLTVIFWILIYIPIIYNTDIINGVCDFIPSAYTKFNTYFFTPLVYGVGPAVIITYSTLGTVRNLRSGTVHAAQNRLAKQVRAMLMPQLIILAISGIPFGFQSVYLELTSTMKKTPSQVATENFVGQVILIFYHFNYVFIFYIYVWKSSVVRNALKKQFSQCMHIRHIGTRNNILTTSITLRKINPTNLTQTKY